MHWLLVLLKNQRLLLDDKKDGNEGGGGTSSSSQPDIAKMLTELKTDMIARLEKLESRGRKKTDEDDTDESDEDDTDDLVTKAKKTKENEAKDASKTKQLEAALKFQLGAAEWLKTNQALLPKDIGDIFKAAEKENYQDAIERDQAIKAGIIQSFFGVQANHDLLTPALKTQLDDYLKLTKNGKQDKALQIFDTVFEPAFEMLRQVTRAKALSKGYGNPSDTEDAYKQKMIDLSRKHYLGEVKHA